jgi:acyl-coenzyme A thioesterase THEM4
MGNLLTVNHERMGSLMLNMFTVFLNVRFLKPIPTPSVILGTAQFTKLEKRKHFIKSTLEDGQGTVYAIGEGLFASPKSSI